MTALLLLTAALATPMDTDADALTGTLCLADCAVSAPVTAELDGDRGMLVIDDHMTFQLTVDGDTLSLVNDGGSATARCERADRDGLSCTGTFEGPDGDSAFTLNLVPTSDELAWSVR